MSVSREPSHTHNAAGLMAPASEASDKQEPGVWYRQGRLLYSLKQVGWRRGKPLLSNRLTVRVEGDYTPKGEAAADALTGQILALIAAATDPDDGDHKSSATERSDLTRDEQP